MEKINCWDFRKCGREPGGDKESELGACPAAEESRLNGVHDGINGGRACWVVRRTLCENVVDRDIVSKYDNCQECEFLKKVKREEGAGFVFASELFNIMRQLQF